MSYQAPIKDMLFVLNELANLQQVSQLPGCEDATADTVEAVLEENAKFCGEVVAPLNQPSDKEPSFWHDGQVTTSAGFKVAFQAFGESGWQGIQHPQEFGGQGLPKLVGTPCTEMLNAASISFALVALLTDGAIEALLTAGSDEQKALYLEPLITGKWTGTMNLTEPQAGSDLSAIRSKAVPEGDHYRVSGNKIFITWGEHDMAENIVHLVLARLPDAPAGVKGISLFVCPKFLVNADGSLGARNDLMCTAIEHKLGIHASPTAVMSFGDQGGAIGYLVGEAHKGLGYMFTMMNHARLNVGLEGVAIAERAYQRARAYALDRVQGRTLVEGSPAIIGHPDVRRMLMTMKARVEAMRAIAYFAAGEMDRAHGHPDEGARVQKQAMVDLLIPIVKGWCTETAQLVVADGVQVHGGMGFIEETGAAQHLRDARITTIYEGTTGIQANDLIGRKLMREGGVTMKALQRSMLADAHRLAEAEDAELRPLGVGLQRGLDALSQATEWLLTCGPQRPAASAAGAVPYLHLCGTVLGAWLMARAAEAAQARRLRQDGDAAALGAKLATAHHYLHHVLVDAPAWRDRVVNGASSTLSLQDAQF